MAEERKQEPPGRAAAMANKPDHGEHSYRGTGRLADKVAVITGAASGIGAAIERARVLLDAGGYRREGK